MAKDHISAWAVIEKRGDKIAILSAEVPVFWLRKVAQAHANDYNSGGNYVHVEKVTVHRVKRKSK